MDIKLPDIIFYLINFSVMMGALSYLIYKPVLRVLDNRAKKIEEAQKAAEETIKERNEMEKTKTQVLKDAEKEARERAQATLKQAQDQSKEIVAKAKADAESTVARLTQEFEAEKQELLENWQKKFTAQVLKTAEHVIGASVDKKTATQLIDQDLEALLKTI
jgi:F-type H+-transporting ATPase subunit b